MVNKDCPYCYGLGYEQVNEDGEIQFVECRCRRMNPKDIYRLGSGIGVGMNNMNFDNYLTGDYPVLKNAKLKAKQYVISFDSKIGQRNNSILFCGQPGAGKTHLGIAISDALIGKEYKVIYMPYRNSITEIKQNVLNYEMYRKLMEKYEECDVLYIDDFLKGKITEADCNVLYEIVNHRYNNNLSMIISTEKSIADILEFDEAIGSRIIEMCMDNIIKFEGAKYNYRIYNVKTFGQLEKTG